MGGTLYAALLAKYGSLAQSVEQLTFNQLVRGSSPRRPTTIPDKTKLFY